MVQTNFFEKEICLKILYYGTPGAGKKTNLEALYQKIAAGDKTDISEEKAGKGAIYSFDYTSSKSLAGMKIRCLVCAISGEASKAEVNDHLQGADGVVFVVDSAEDVEKANQCLETVEECIDVDEIPLVFQYNKKDLNEEIESLDDALNKFHSQTVQASAETGEGVYPTWELILDQVLEKVEKQFANTTKRLPKKKITLSVSKAKDGEKKIVKNPLEKIKVPKVPKKWRTGDKSSQEKGESEKKTEEFDDEQLAKTEAINKKEVLSDEDDFPLVKEDEVEISTKEQDKEEQDVDKEGDSIFDDDEDIITSRPEDEAKEETQVLGKKQDLLPILEENSNDEADESAATVTEKYVERDISGDTTISEPPSLSEVMMKRTPLDTPLVRPKPKTKKFSHQEEIIEQIESGEGLEGMKIDVLDLRNLMISAPLHISKSQIGRMLCDGTTFARQVNIEDTVINESLQLSGEVGSLFRDTLTFKRVELSGEINWENIVACKGVSILDSNWYCRADLPKGIFEREVFIANSKLHSMYCEDTHFRGEVTVTGCIFDDILSLERSTLEKLYVSGSQVQRAHFMEARFHDCVEFVNTTFEKSGNFTRMSAEKGMCIEGCVFNGNADFSHSSIKSFFDLQRTEFFGDTAFHKMGTKGTQTFENVTFASMADFSRTALQQASFIQSQFQGVANFHEASFAKNASFLESCFEREVHFSRAIFHQKVNFTQCEFKGLLSFNNVVGDYIVLHREQVEKKLLSVKHRDYERAAQEYITLKNLFAQQGHFADRDWAHYHAKKYGRKKYKFSLLHPFRNVWKVLDWIFLDLGSGYGTKPKNVFLLGVFFILAFAALYGCQFSSEVEKYPSALADLIGRLQIVDLQHWGKWLQATELSFKIFVPTAFSLQEPSAWFQLIAIGQGFLGVFLVFLFVLVFIKKMLQS